MMVDYSITTADAAWRKNDKLRAGLTVEYINSMQKFSNIALIASIAGIALAILAVVLMSEILMFIASPAILIGVGMMANIRFKRRPDFEKAIEILKRMPQVIVQGGETIFGLYMNAYKFEAL